MKLLPKKRWFTINESFFNRIGDKIVIIYRNIKKPLDIFFVAIFKLFENGYGTYRAGKAKFIIICTLFIIALFSSLAYLNPLFLLPILIVYIIFEFGFVFAREHYKRVLARQANGREIQNTAFEYYAALSNDMPIEEESNTKKAYAKTEKYYTSQLHVYATNFIEKIYNHKLENEAMKEENKKIYKRVAEEVSEEMSKEIEEAKQKAKEQIRNNIFSDPEGVYSKSDFINRDEAYRKRKEQEAELIRREDQIKLEEKLFTMMKRIHEVESESKQRDMEITKNVNLLSTKIQEEVSRINSQMVVMEAGLGKRIDDLSHVVDKQGLKMDQIAFEAYQNFKYVSNQLESEVLRLERNDMELFNQIDDAKKQFERGLLLADVKMTKGFTEVSNRINQINFDLKTTDKELRHLIEIKGYEAKDFMQKSFSQINNDLKDVRHNFKYEMMQSDHKWDSRTKDMEKQFTKDMYQMDRKVEREVFRLERNDMELSNQINNAKSQFERELLLVDVKMNKGFTEVSNRINQINFDLKTTDKDLRHLVEIKGYEAKDFMQKSYNEIKNDLKDVRHNFKYEMMQSDHKWDSRTKDMEKQFMKDMYEMDKKLLQVIDKVKEFSHEIKGMNLEISKMENELATHGSRNEMMIEKAKMLVESLALRMQNIDSSLKLAQSVADNTEERLALRTREDLLKLQQITIDQENKLKEIVYAEKGAEIIHRDQMNRQEERKLALDATRNEIRVLEEKMRILNQQAERDARYQNKIDDLNQRLHWEKETLRDQERQYQDVKNAADYWKQEYKKESRSTYRNANNRYSDYL